MGDYHGQGFAVRLPDGVTDLSTYAFVLPSAADFKPSVVIKHEVQDLKTDLRQYMIEQRSQLRKQVDEFEVIREVGPEPDKPFPRVETDFEWKGSGAPRVRQRQVFIHARKRRTIYTLTATDTAANFPNSELMFTRIIDSFVPSDV